MAVAVCPVPILRFFDSDGNPLAGGRLATFITGSSTPSPLYSDAEATTTEYANPTILNADGYISANGTAPSPAYMDPAIALKFVLSDANDVEIYTADPVRAVAVAV